jgi:negative regulator of replication initiation
MHANFGVLSSPFNFRNHSFIQQRLISAMSDSSQPTTSTVDESKSVVSAKRRADEQVTLSSENRTIKLVKKPRILLEEDDFTGELEKIIVRDYFPEVPRLKVRVLLSLFV